MSFQVNGQTPPRDAEPDRNRSPVVIYPRPTAKRGTGIPTRAVGLPYAKVGRAWISQTGLNWWTAFFSSPDDLYVDVTVQVLDPLSNSWRTATAHMWRPTYDRVTTGQEGSNLLFRNFEVRLTGIQFT